VSHGGEEFTSLPSPYTRDRYLKFLELGADVVVGHHPHVPENYELFDDGKAIFYSLGNFIFDTDYQRVHFYTDLGVLLKLVFTEEKMDFEAMGIQIVRGEERIVEAALPDVFTNIPAEEYELLAPLSAKAFVVEDMRKMIYLERDRFTNAPQEVWDGYFFSEEPDGYFEGAHMDFNIIVPYSKKADDGEWKKSKLEKVKEYILKQNPFEEF
jgi:poly-gamma-glutamate synthesis protein (capsule biosynthesis protein)